MIKVGQIGIGHNHAAPKMEAFRRFPKLYEIVGVFEKNEKHIAERGKLPQYQGLKFYDSEDALIDACDLILVECDVWDLTKTAARVAKKGKHIHLDKPASGTYSEFESLLDIMKEKNLVLQMGYMYRYNPQIMKCFEMVRSGELGDIVSITAEMSTYHSTEYRKWLEHFNGGTMYIFGCHLIDLVISLCGIPKKITPVLCKTGIGGTNSNDNDLCIMEYEHSIAKIFTSSVEANGWGRRQFTVCGTKGTAEIRPLENPVKMTFAEYGKGAEYFENYAVDLPTSEPAPNERYDIMAKDLYKYITGEKENPYTYEYELALHKCVLSASGEELK